MSAVVLAFLDRMRRILVEQIWSHQIEKSKKEKQHWKQEQVLILLNEI